MPSNGIVEDLITREYWHATESLQGIRSTEDFTEPLSGTFLFNAGEKGEVAGDISSVLLI